MANMNCVKCWRIPSTPCRAAPFCASIKKEDMTMMWGRRRGVLVAMPFARICAMSLFWNKSGSSVVVGVVGLSSMSNLASRGSLFSSLQELKLDDAHKKKKTQLQQQLLPGLVYAEKSQQEIRKVIPQRKKVSIPILARDENGNIYLKTAGERAGPATPSSSSPSSLGERDDDAASPKKKQTTFRIATGVKKPAPTSSGLPRYTKAARRFYNQKFRAEPERLSKVLAAAGVASRRGSEDIIFAGRVKVNGKVCTLPQTPVDPLKDVIFLNGRSLPKKPVLKFYFALNKPKGYICSNAAEGSKPVLSLFEDYWKIWSQRNPGMQRPRLFTVGRLDVATSGLLLVTNDGDFAQKVSHPSYGLTKEYVATVTEKVSKRQVQLIAQGTKVQGVQCVPTQVELLDAAEPGDARHRIRIEVCEGRNHEVRQLVANAGLEVQGLKRVRIGGLRLSRKLAAGKYEVLTETQVNKVMEKPV
ncbi:unnamed protein product [Sphagnum balticum]